MKILTMTLALFFTLVISLITAVTVSAFVQPSTPVNLDGFGTCEGRPCFFGIAAGVTAWDEARSILQARWQNAARESEIDAQDTQRIIVNYGDGGTLLLLESDRHRNKVRRIIWMVQPNTCCAVALATILARYDQMCADWRTQLQYQGVTPLRYLNVNQQRYSGARKPALSTKVYLMILSANQSLLCR